MLFLSDAVRLLDSIVFIQNLKRVNSYSVQERLTSLGDFKILVLSAFFFTISFNFITVEGNYLAFAHIFGSSSDGGEDDISSLGGTKNQTAGNYVIDLLLNPSKPMIDKNTEFLMQIKSTQGDEIIELPVSFYILKEGDPIFSDPNNFVLVRQGHYDFNYTFSEPGKYILFVDIKDIFYTLDVLTASFEIDVQVPVLERINESIANFLITYYYIFVIIAALVGISYAVRIKRRKGVKQTT
ncbi:hypothetical protein [Candidatus Nitrosocosmicus franklandus]|uniref:YtkA-like domain-containing protein n=1 Tax=Candidatus Nitrosocosmicus franklandianus TaxID=1798806 RepID=A0A484IDE0_9ARCH|nr:hypothetical protein [Candidatus Nitrosocosmicus franklandus]VFJ13680.1 conserved protein of unknown function [Candidatus Nitrosocosmicus franklandus]